MRAKTFSGGYRFKRRESHLEDKPTYLDTPSKIIIPLSQGFGASLAPKVKVGQKVCAGQIIAQDDGKISSPIHSSVNGQVIKIEKKNSYLKLEWI